MSGTDFERLNIILTARDRELSRVIDRQTRKIEQFAGKADKGLSRTSKRFNEVGTAAKTSATGLGRVINISGSGRFVLQNTAAQMGDIAVQLESGTAASRVMAQQLPQVLGGFGALGGALGLVAPLLGTVAAVGIPIGAMLMSMGGDSEAAAGDVKTFADALDNARGAMERAEAAISRANGVEDIGEIYGEVTRRVMELGRALADIEARAAAQETAAAMRKLLGENGVAASVLTASDRMADATRAMAEMQAENARIQQMLKDDDLGAMLDAYGSRGSTFDRSDELIRKMNDLRDALPDVNALASALGATEQEARDLVAAMAEAAQAQGPENMAAAYLSASDVISDIRARLHSAGQDVSDGLVAEFTHLEDLLRSNAATLDDARANADGLGDSVGAVGGEMREVNAETRRLVGNLGQAMAALTGVTTSIKLANARALRDAKIRQETIGDPEGRAAAFARQDFRDESGAAAYAMIRSGNASRLGELRETADQVAEGAAKVAAAEEALAAAEAKFRESQRDDTKGGGRKSTEKKAQEVRDYEGAVERLGDAFSASSVVAQGYRAEIEALKSAYDQGKISGDALSEGLDDIESDFQRAARAAESLEKAAGNAFANIITNASSVGEALSGLASQWASMFAQAAGNSLASAIPGLDQLGEILSFDGGGYTGSGPRSGGIDGKGGMPAIVHPNETIIDHTRGQALPATRGQGGPVSISIEVSGARGNSEVSEMVREGVRQGLQEYDRAVLPRSVGRINRDPRKVT